MEKWRGESTRPEQKAIPEGYFPFRSQDKLRITVKEIGE